jgi:hypothetical protein
MPLITFKTSTKQSFEMNVEDTVTIGDIKQKIQTEKGAEDFPIERQKLIYYGRLLGDSATIGSFQFFNIPLYI